ncbi:MAG: hypothetical protein QM775_12825 [Pirellulales bacterium]
MSWDDLRSRLFGREWLLAVYPPDGEADDDDRRPPTGFLLLRAADAELLDQAVKKLLAVHRKEDRYRGSTKFERGDRSLEVHEFQDESGHSLFLCYEEDFGCLATSRAKLGDVLSRYLDSSDVRSAGSLAASAEYQAAAQSRAPDAALRIFVQARSWQPYYRRWLQQDAEKADAAARKIGEMWKYLKFFAADVTLHPTLRVDLQAAWDEESLSDEFRGVLKSLAAKASPAAEMPVDCLAAASGRIDLKRIADFVVAVQSRDAKRRGKSLPTEALLAARIAGGLGPGFTAYMTPAAAYSEHNKKSEGKVPDVGPVEWVAGFDTQPLLAGEPTLADAFEPLIRLSLVLAADAYNAESAGKARVDTSRVGDLQMTGLTGIGPFVDAGFYVAHQSQRLWFSGSPGAIAAAAKGKPEKSLAENSLFQQVGNPRMQPVSQFLFVNLQEIRRTTDAVLAKSPAAFVALQSEPARRGLGEITSLLSLADAAVLEAAVGESDVRVSLAVTVSK